MTAVNEGWWDFRNPVRILFGPRRLTELLSLVAMRRVLLITTRGFTKRGLTSQVHNIIGADRMRVLDNVQPNPDLRDIENDSRALLGESIEVVIGLGGGSALDTAKTISFILSAGAPECLRAHFEYRVDLPHVIPMPVIAIPTTAGTGSEVTPFATVWDRQREKKYSLATPHLYPEVALLDPELTLSLPRDVTVTTGLDALSQAFEAIWNRNSTPITTAYALKAIGIVFQKLPKLINGLHDLEYRSRMMEASLLSGLAISRTRTALAHSISYPITARHGMPHGLACSFTLPALLDFNAQADDGRFAEVVVRLGFASVAALRDGLSKFLLSLGVDAFLKKYISSIEDLVNLAPEMLTPGRADNNLRSASIDNVKMILKTAWENYSS